jgi:hypothetical protein
VNLPGFSLLVVIVIVFVVIFVASLVLIIEIVVFLEVVVVNLVAELEATHKGSRDARLFSHGAGSVVVFGLSRLGGGYVDQK